MKAVGVDVFLWRPISVDQSLLAREQKCGTKVPIGKYKKYPRTKNRGIHTIIVPVPKSIKSSVLVSESDTCIRFWYYDTRFDTSWYKLIQHHKLIQVDTSWYKLIQVDTSWYCDTRFDIIFDTVTLNFLYCRYCCRRETRTWVRRKLLNFKKEEKDEKPTCFRVMEERIFKHKKYGRN